MSYALLITVRFVDDRYHGVGDWPPSPFRVLQALLCGALAGQPPGRTQDLVEAFKWFEALKPPAIAFPPARRGKTYHIYVPNNDLDTVGGDPERIAEIRGDKKHISPWLITRDAPLLYLWQFDDANEDHCATIATVSEQLYRLGRGIDMAFASAEVMPAADAQERLAGYDGNVCRPSKPSTGDELKLRCPTPGSVESLVRRHLCSEESST